MTTIRGTTHLSSAWSNLDLAPEPMEGPPPPAREQTADLFALAVVTTSSNRLGGRHPLRPAGQADLAADQIRRGTFPHVAGAGSPIGPRRKLRRSGPAQGRRQSSPNVRRRLLGRGPATHRRRVGQVRAEHEGLDPCAQVFTPPAADPGRGRAPRAKFRRACCGGGCRRSRDRRGAPAFSPRGGGGSGRRCRHPRVPALRPTFRRPRSYRRPFAPTRRFARPAAAGASTETSVHWRRLRRGRASRLASRVPIRRETMSASTLCRHFYSHEVKS